MDFGSFILCGIFFLVALLSGLGILLGRALLAYPASPRLKKFFLISTLLFASSFLYNYKVFYLDEGLACLTGISQTQDALRLLRLGADPNAATESGDTVLVGAIGNENTVLVKALLSGGADVNKEATIFLWQKGLVQITPMQAALKTKNPQIIQMLRNAGARP